MATNYSRTILLGYLAADPETKKRPGTGKKVVRFTLLTFTDKTDLEGKRSSAAERHRIVVLNDPIAEVASRIFRKGMKLLVEGQNQTRRYTDAAGVERQITEVVIGAYRGWAEIVSDKDDPDSIRLSAGEAVDHPPPGGVPAL